jgi:hypothetical protein
VDDDQFATYEAFGDIKALVQQDHEGQLPGTNVSANKRKSSIYEKTAVKLYV